MRSVRVPQELIDRVSAEARASYPDEACGFLLSAEGDSDGPRRTVSSALPAPNEFDGERRRRFVISPTALRLAEETAAVRGEVVVGFYHSHPDHPAIPSAFDAEHAWPWYTYLVVSVDATGVRGVGAFELDAERRSFDPSDLAVASSNPARVERPAPLLEGA
jgi:proteasome lid subunit RPN8/RPN11